MTNMNKTNINRQVGATQRVYYMTNLIGKKYLVYLDPAMSDVRKIVDSIKIQLPASYNNDKFRVICEGRDLLSFSVFDKGVDSYFRTLANIHVVGGSSHDLIKRLEDYKDEVKSDKKPIIEILEDYKDEVKSDKKPIIERLYELEREKNNSLETANEMYKEDCNNGAGKRVYYMTSLIGKKYLVYLDPAMSDVKKIVDSIKMQLPESYNNDNFRVICEGRDLLSFGVFDKGVDSYFRNLANIHVIGC